MELKGNVGSADDDFSHWRDGDSKNRHSIFVSGVFLSWRARKSQALLGTAWNACRPIGHFKVCYRRYGKGSRKVKTPPGTCPVTLPHRELPHHPGVFMLEDVAVVHVGRVAAGPAVEADDDLGFAGDQDCVPPARILGSRGGAAPLIDGNRKGGSETESRSNRPKPGRNRRAITGFARKSDTVSVCGTSFDKLRTRRWEKRKSPHPEPVEGYEGPPQVQTETLRKKRST